MKFQLRRKGLKEFIIYQPKIAIVADSEPFDALIDSGGDFIWLPTDEKLTKVDGLMNGIPVMQKTIDLIIEHEGESYAWRSRVLYSQHKFKPILGYLGFLEYFVMILDALQNTVTIEPNRNFPGDVTRDLHWDETTH